MKTSCFSIAGNNKNGVAICQYPPSYYAGRIYRALAPSVDLLRAYKIGWVSQESFVTRYREETLSKLSAQRVFDDLGNSAILLCHEKPGEFCHRRIVAKWLESELSIEVPELQRNQTNQGDITKWLK